jgi:hypothetical protein
LARLRLPLVSTKLLAVLPARITSLTLAVPSPGLLEPPEPPGITELPELPELPPPLLLPPGAATAIELATRRMAAIRAFMTFLFVVELISLRV